MWTLCHIGRHGVKCGCCATEVGWGLLWRLCHRGGGWVKCGYCAAEVGGWVKCGRCVSELEMIIYTIRSVGKIVPVLLFSRKSSCNNFPF